MIPFNPFDWPRWAQTLLGGFAAIVVFMVAKGFYDRSVINEHEAEIAAEIRELETAAASDAAKAVTETRNEVEKSNAQARNAAARSDDPLGDGLRSLRP